MNLPARAQFIEAGVRLYPQLGYRKLSVRLLAAEAGLSPGMFHHLFASKDEFVAELLQSQYEHTFGRVDFLPDQDADVVQKLRHAIRLLAFCLRDNLAWVNRIFADSADGVNIEETFLRRRFDNYSGRLYALLSDCFPDTPFPELVKRMSYISASVVAPMFLGIRFSHMGMLPEDVRSHIFAVLDDDAIEERIRWTFSALFPNYSFQEKP